MQIAKQDILKFTALLLFIFLSIIFIFKHEPWRDEAQVWLVVRDTPNFDAFIKQLGYEATPGLWYFLVYPFAKANLPYLSMALIHSFITIISAFIFLRYSPFTNLNKILFIFGYFIIYEYNIIVRNYAISVLLLFLIATFYERRLKKPFIYSLLLVLLANSNTFSLFIALILMSIYFLEFYSTNNFRRFSLYAIIILLPGMLLAYYQAAPPEDYTLITWNSDFTLERLANIPNSVVGAFIPVPQIKLNFWGSKIVYATSLYLVALGLPIYLFSLLILIKKPKPFLIYFSSTIILFAIFFFIHRGAIRHHGFIYIMFIFSFWISKFYKEKPFKFKLPGTSFLNKNEKAIFGCIFLIHIVAGIFALNFEYNYDFSGSKKLEDYLINEDLINKQNLITTYHSRSTSSILPYISNSSNLFYCLEYEDYCSYMVWNNIYDKTGNLPINEVMERINMASKGKIIDNIIFISDVKIEDLSFNSKYSLIKSFTNTIVESESFYIYKKD